MSFWDDIQIGDTSRKQNSSWNILDLQNEHRGHISENSTSYWISGAYLDVGMVIMKDTKEGLQLQKMLKANAKTPKINDWLARLVFRKLPADRLMAKIEAEKEAKFESGRKHQAALIREALHPR